MATNLRSLGRTAAKAVRSSVNDARRRRKHNRESSRGPRMSRKAQDRQIAISRENSRRSGGGMM